VVYIRHGSVKMAIQNFDRKFTQKIVISPRKNNIKIVFLKKEIS
jgi:hypothetical protein